MAAKVTHGPNWSVISKEGSPLVPQQDGVFCSNDTLFDLVNEVLGQTILAYTLRTSTSLITDPGVLTERSNINGGAVFYGASTVEHLILKTERSKWETIYQQPENRLEITHR